MAKSRNPARDIMLAQLIAAAPAHSLADRLRNARRACGFTQIELADMADVHQTSINKVESGLSLWPRCIPDVANILGVNPAWLMFGINHAPQFTPEEPFK